MESYSIVIVFSFESSQVMRAVYVLHEIICKHKHLGLKIIFKEESSMQSGEITFLSFSLYFFY